MARAKQRTAWSPANVNTLRRLAGKKPPKAIAKKLKRTEAAVRFKAHTESISLSMR
jgi:hypothetical protein